MSLTTAVRSLRRTYSKKFPGASDSDLGTFLGFAFQAALTNPKATYKDEEAVAVAETELAAAAERGEQWAVNLRDAVLINVVKPIVDKAADKDVDPVPALVLQVNITEEEAREYVAQLENRSSDSDSDADSSVEVDTEADEDESDGDAAAPAVSYGYGTPTVSA